MDKNATYLSTYVLQKDMRIRLPKAILANLDAEKGVTEFDIFYDTTKQEIILKLANKEDSGNAIHRK